MIIPIDGLGYPMPASGRLLAQSQDALNTAKPIAPSAGLTDCPWRHVKSMLHRVGLRPTRQRIALGWILFANGARHLTADTLHEEASRANVSVSLATVYNTLHQFTEVGLLRQIAVDGSKTYFDTNVGGHHHFLVEGENELLDILGAESIVERILAVPDGYEVSRVDVIVRLRPNTKRG